MSTVGVGPQSVQLTVEERSKTGRRKSNQDAPIRVEVVPGRVYLVGVADGMGGYAGGEQASAAALKHIQLFGELLRTHLPDDDKMALRFIRDRIEGLYADVQREIQSIATADPNLGQMGTTLVMAAICGRYFFVANIGDSRAYLLYRDSRGQDVFRQITEDHTVSNDARRAGEQIALETPEAQKLGKALTRALRPNTPSRPELFPPDSADSPGYVGKDGDTLLISSDGMYGSVDEDDMEVLLVESSTLIIALEKLEDKAYGNESADNITTVAVDFGPRDPRRKAARRAVVGVTDTMLSPDFALPAAPPAPSANPVIASQLTPPPTEAPARTLPLAAILIASALLLGAGAFGLSAVMKQPTPQASPTVTAPLPTPVPEASAIATPGTSETSETIEATGGARPRAGAKVNNEERNEEGHKNKPDRERVPGPARTQKPSSQRSAVTGSSAGSAGGSAGGPVSGSRTPPKPAPKAGGNPKSEPNAPGHKIDKLDGALGSSGKPAPASTPKSNALDNL